MESKTPPPGYICHRCNVAGHCIHHCPTNGDSNYNVKRVKPPTGIPKSMLVALIHCQVVQLQLLNQKRKDAFDKEIEGLPSTTRSVGEFTSICCFQSFCVTISVYVLSLNFREFLNHKKQGVTGVEEMLSHFLIFTIYVPRSHDIHEISNKTLHSWRRNEETEKKS
ncbi:hypothetical protein IGI04_039927 [Brassica rapa subsp. trilocularis]|uniref:CCHC-type domain-containing protein n=1 Tax=Brassica rapa subsp. trilocularis TaxID=1813537 RepID=A0ABQ7KMT2_BRACM|nr:hypothetical protein IGI04_039927 [Brassica rapa subsp. trilocularis]